MSYLTYVVRMSPKDKPLVWLHGEVTTPPLTREARIEAGFLLRRLQRGDRVGMPYSRPMPSIEKRCHELRILDEDQTWRLVYRIDSDAIVILDVILQKTAQTPRKVIAACRRRLSVYDAM